MKQFNPFAMIVLINDSIDKKMPIVDQSEFDLSDHYLLELVYEEIKENNLKHLIEMYDRLYDAMEHTLNE